MVGTHVLTVVAEGVRFAVHRWTSSDELEADVARAARHVIIGIDVPVPDRFTAIHVQPVAPGSGGTIAVMCGPYSLDPKLSVTEGGGTVVIATDHAVTVVVLDTFSSTTIEFDTYVHDLLPTQYGPLVQTEIGLVALTPDGDRRWACEHDLVDQVSIDGETVAIAFQDGRRVRVDIRSGEDAAPSVQAASGTERPRPADERHP